MDADPWTSRLSSASKRYQSSLLSRSGMFMGFEELEGDDDIREEFPCPFCAEYFDIVGLCCHIDEEHPIEAKTGVCPVCDTRVGVDMINPMLSSLTSGYMQRKRKSRKGGSHSTLSLLRKELQEGNLQSLFGGSSYLVTSNSVPDPLLSSFILPLADDYGNVQPRLSAESSSAKSNSQVKLSERSIPSSPLSMQDKEEKAKRSGFVQGLLMSTILGDNL
ncbi:Protein DEHYDRATION-INDUCED 19-like 3, partial [Cucurbita argyrosperma subsp. argyrosperma]